MKKITLVFTLMFCVFVNIYAQEVTVEEPDFAEETLMILSDTYAVPLARENGFFKYLRGWSKVKTMLVVDGKSSHSYTVKGKSTTRLIIKAKDNLTDPNSFINIFKFEIKNNERRYDLSELGLGSKYKTNNIASISYKAKKYGESSYLITMDGLTPGEYGIFFGDPNITNSVNGWKVTTFTVE